MFHPVLESEGFVMYSVLMEGIGQLQKCLLPWDVNIGPIHVS